MTIVDPPDTRVTLGRAEATVRWEPLGGPPLVLQADAAGGDWPVFICKVADDGEFTLPGSVLDRVGDAPVSISTVLRRWRGTEVEVEPDRWARFWVYSQGYVNMKLDPSR